MWICVCESGNISENTEFWFISANLRMRRCGVRQLRPRSFPPCTLLESYPYKLELSRKANTRPILPWRQIIFCNINVGIFWYQGILSKLLFCVSRLMVIVPITATWKARLIHGISRETRRNILSARNSANNTYFWCGRGPNIPFSTHTSRTPGVCSSLCYLIGRKVSFTNIGSWSYLGHFDKITLTILNASLLTGCHSLCMHNLHSAQVGVK